MQEMYVRVKSFQDVRAISVLAGRERYRITISDGRRTVNAKSLMGIFTLNLGGPLLLQLDCGDDEGEAFRGKATRFVEA